MKTTFAAAQNAWDNRAPPESNEFLSLQPLGDGEALVAYDLGDHDAIAITAAYVNGCCVDASDFALNVVERWESLILAELAKERDDATADLFEAEAP